MANLTLTHPDSKQVIEVAPGMEEAYLKAGWLVESDHKPAFEPATATTTKE